MLVHDLIVALFKANNHEFFKDQLDRREKAFSEAFQNSGFAKPHKPSTPKLSFGRVAEDIGLIYYHTYQEEEEEQTCLVFIPVNDEGIHFSSSWAHQIDVFGRVSLRNNVMEEDVLEGIDAEIEKMKEIFETYHWDIRRLCL